MTLVGHFEFQNGRYHRKIWIVAPTGSDKAQVSRQICSFLNKYLSHRENTPQNLGLMEGGLSPGKQNDLRHGML